MVHFEFRVIVLELNYTFLRTNNDYKTYLIHNL